MSAEALWRVVVAEGKPVVITGLSVELSAKPDTQPAVPPRFGAEYFGARFGGADLTADGWAATLRAFL